MREEVQIMRKMRADGYSLREIADRFGLSISTVYDYVKDVCYERRAKKGRGQRIGEYEKEQIMKMYTSGMKVSEIARRLGLHYQTVYRYIKKEMVSDGELDTK